MQLRTDLENDEEDIEIKLTGTGIWYPDDDLTLLHTPVSLN
jgi:hypothetical protein